MLNLDFERTFQDIFDKLSANIADIGSIVAGIIGIGALFYFAGKTWGALARNEPIDIYPLLKPLVITFLCLNFYSVVITPMHYILSPLRTYTVSLASDAKLKSESAREVILKKAQERRKAEKEAQKAKRREPRVTENGIILPDSYVSNFVRELWDGVTPEIKNVILQVLIEVSSIARNVIYFAMNCLRLFFLIILGMIGPIAFTLSLFPSFEGSLSNWFAKYISIYLWAPVCNIVSIILNQIELLMTENLLLSSGGWSADVILIIFYVIGFGCYLSIPTIATWAVQGGASAMELGSALQSARKAALIAGGAGAAIGGKMSGGIKESIKNVVSKFKK